MKFTKFDYIQIVFNVLLVAAALLNCLYLVGVLPQFVTFIGLILAIVGCIFTNTATGGRQKGLRQEVNGNPVLAGLTFVTGALWLLTYAAVLFGRAVFGGA